MKKVYRMLVAMLSSILVFSAFPATSIAANNKYDSNWVYWSQGGSGIGGYMNSSGCYIVSQAKLLAESGIADTTSFNPDVYANWAHDNGYFGRKGTSLSAYVGMQGQGNFAPQYYARAVNKTLNYCGSISISGYTREQQSVNIKEWLMNDYYVILEFSGHRSYVWKNKSISENEIYLADTSSKLLNSAEASDAASKGWKQDPAKYLTPLYESYDLKAINAYLYSPTKTILPGRVETYSVSTTRADKVSDASYTLYGSATSSGAAMTECGMYIGTSESGMTKLGSDRINLYKTNMWYNTTKYGYTLQPGTTYYYRAYAVINGTERAASNTGSFTTPPGTETISLNRTSLTMKDTECIQLTATTTPANQAVMWSSSDTSVATVENGAVTALKAGKATITASMSYGRGTVFAYCDVTVTASANADPKISLNRTNLTMKDAERVQLTATTTPANQTVIWSSSDTSVATVDDGTVTALKAGKTTIMASMSYGRGTVFAYCDVTVTASANADPKISLNRTNLTMKDAQRVQLTATTTPANQTVIWSSSDTSVATVDDGTVTALKAGKTTIMASMSYGRGTVFAYCDVAVISPIKVSFEVNSGRQSIEATNATLSDRMNISGTSATSVSKVGIYLYDAHGNQIAEKSETPSVSGNYPYIDIWYDVNSRLGYTLNQNTTYRYRFYGIIGDEIYWGDLRLFTTLAQSVTTRIGIVTGTSGRYLAINDKPAASPANSTQIGRIPPGGQITVYTDKTSGNWYWVEYNGVQGYAYKNYITLK